VAPPTLASLFSLRGRVALVTGGSTGLGLEFARALAIAGADVAVVARHAAPLARATAEVAALGVRCEPIATDLSDPDAVQALPGRVAAALGGLDILVNNAGTGAAARAERHPLDAWLAVLGLDLSVPFALSRHALPWLRRSGQGRIINVSSIMGTQANPIYPTAAYTAAKGALNALTRQLAVEWAPLGVTVNTLAPGSFPTRMTGDRGDGQVDDRHKEMLAKFVPLGRPGRTGELTAAIIFLASPAASYVTGTVLAVDGGWSGR